MSKLVNTTVRMSREESEAFSKFASKYGVSKSELFLRATRWAVTSSNQDNFIAPYLPSNYIITRLASMAVERGLVDSEVLNESV